MKLALDGCLSLGSEDIVVCSNIFVHWIMLFDCSNCYFHLIFELRQILMLIDNTCLEGLVFGLDDWIEGLFFHLHKMLLTVLDTLFVLLFIASFLSKFFGKVLNLYGYLMNFFFSSLELQLILLNLQKLELFLVFELGGSILRAGAAKGTDIVSFLYLFSSGFK